jgi:hypothetical protein
MISSARELIFQRRKTMGAVLISVRSFSVGEWRFMRKPLANLGKSLLLLLKCGEEGVVLGRLRKSNLLGQYS